MLSAGTANYLLASVAVLNCSHQPNFPLRTDALQHIRLPTQCPISSHFLSVPSRYANYRYAGNDCAFVSYSTVRLGTTPPVPKLLSKTFAFRTLVMLARVPPRFP